MKEKIIVKLMDGIFESERGARILLELLNSKVRFHRLEIFSAQETGTGSITHSEQRIKELNAEIAKLKEFLQHCKSTNCNISAKGSIELAAIPNE